MNENNIQQKSIELSLDVLNMILFYLRKIILSTN